MVVGLSKTASVNCTRAEMLEAAVGTFSITSQFFDDTNKRVRISDGVHTDVAHWKKLHGAVMKKVRKR